MSNRQLSEHSPFRFSPRVRAQILDVIDSLRGVMLRYMPRAQRGATIAGDGLRHAWAWLRANFWRFLVFKRARRAIAQGMLTFDANIHGEGVEAAWQPVPWVLAKVAAIIGVAWWAFTYHPVVGGWLEEMMNFFRLSEIYNFELPGRDSFNRVAALLFGVALGYPGIYLLIQQIEGLFSTLVISTHDHTLYYVQSHLVRRALHVFPLDRIESIRLEQLLPARLIGIGTIVLRHDDGTEIRIASVRGARRLIRSLNDAHRISRRPQPARLR